MISQRCPKCNSSRIRAGYRPTPLWSKLFFRYNLLCDSCNWQFSGFAVPGTVSSKSKSSRKKQPETSRGEEKEQPAINHNAKNAIADGNQVRIKKRIKVKY